MAPDAKLARCMRHLNGVYTQDIIFVINATVHCFGEDINRFWLMRIVSALKLNRYNSVSSVVMRVKTKLQKDRTIKKRLACIESNL